MLVDQVLTPEKDIYLGLLKSEAMEDGGLTAPKGTGKCDLDNLMSADQVLY